MSMYIQATPDWKTIELELVLGGLAALGRLLTNQEDVEKLTMRQHGLPVLRRLLINPVYAENLTMMPRQFGAESLHLPQRQELLLHLPTLEIWMSSAQIVARSDYWPKERSEVRRQSNLF